MPFLFTSVSQVNLHGLKSKNYMSWVKNTFSSSVGKKFIMSITGLFLIVFLVTHLIGNVSLLFKSGDAFNEYAHFMKHNPLIIVGEVVMFLGFLFHIVDGLALEKSNRSKRSQGYAVSHSHKKVSWTSRYMGPFGVVILAFLILHLYDFFRFKYVVTPPSTEVNGVEMADLHSIVVNVFSTDIFHVIIYSVAMLVIGLHLHHGFQSAFQSLGLNHKKYTPAIQIVGKAYAVIIPLLFALIPIFIYLGVQF